MKFFTPRMLKLLAISYAIKTVIVGIAWLVIPDLPQRATALARHAWSSVAGTTATATVSR